MELFLPIAHMDVNIWLIVSFGLAVGFLSGLTGVGGGILITPLLIFIGVPPLVAVGTGAAQIVGGSAIGSYAHWRMGNVDMRMAFVLLAGSWTGGLIGVHIARILEAGGHFGLVVTFLYVILLGVIGTSMLIESLLALRGWHRHASQKNRTKNQSILQRLPGQMDFPVSGLRLSFLTPVLLGFGVGLLTALMGVGGGFVMVPIMLYVLKMPTKVVVGTSLFQLLFTTAEVGILQAGMNHAVDPYLALALVLGSIFGTQFGARAGAHMKGEQLRLVLALVVVGVAIKMGLGLFITPEHIFSMARVV
ncbi:sulfite exporter TauE/SafE family protein [Acidithiobacillus thiooxidans]|uniref:Probable membrane transporter protein n=1 Tax=Acidithiobacillus thiooxidans ATCC 19377 TaxID=637390 RepID=A0A543Q373_ACITH|nr:sulfite exporter TauE/SafE family protein [Acidithiobacillus thiooxidans]MDR7927382.1 sulfite exporter TauE/SafE family protein [Acidithiobacillus thiooxidans]MDX5935120.1 sulfite exporter TauE/SafE family protein [Acidithiobacillus thiooxidans]TQN50748.1 putative membrane transporter protein YjnA [Acidithiobacillus thiooxidans ATCC 19377]